MTNQISGRRFLLLSFSFFIFANFLAFAKERQDEKTDGFDTVLDYEWEENSEGPGYEVTENPRDPFFPASEPELKVEAETVDEEPIRSSLQVDMVSSSAAGNSAILNQQLVWSGETVKMEVAGKEIALQILEIDPADPCVVVSYEGEEIRIKAGTED